MRYEIFSQHDGFRWRFVSHDGEVLAAASRSLSREQCMRAIQILRMTVVAPIVILPAAPAQETEGHVVPVRRAA